MEVEPVKQAHGEIHVGFPAIAGGESRIRRGRGQRDWFTFSHAQTETGN